MSKAKRAIKASLEKPFAFERSSGVLLHITSLPGAHGVGNLGPAARGFVDWLARAAQSWWQVLPLGPVGAGNSPYQCYSAIAGDLRLISVEDLAQDKLITRDELRMSQAARKGIAADFSAADVGIRKALRRALERLGYTEVKRGITQEPSQTVRAEFEEFCQVNRAWLDDFSLFMALKEKEGEPWHSWPGGLAGRKSGAMASAGKELRDDILLHQFSQFIFFRQLTRLRDYAHERGVRLIGDLPIYVSNESADVWAQPELFLLDRQGRPKAVAGVPPDYFSETGQRWGNPLYDWEAMRASRFDWWVERVRATLRQVDVARIDHFRGLAAYWKIPAHLPTAVGGVWERLRAGRCSRLCRSGLEDCG